MDTFQKSQVQVDPTRSAELPWPGSGSGLSGRVLVLALAHTERLLTPASPETQKPEIRDQRSGENLGNVSTKYCRVLTR